MAMAITITTDHVEAYSLCPRKAFLLMSGAAADPGPHDYEVVVVEQAESGRRAHRLRLAGEAGVAPFGGTGDLAAGREAFADAGLEAGGQQARCDFLARVDEPSGLGRFGYEPVKAIGTRRAAKHDAVGLAHAGLVLGEVQGRLPASGTLARPAGRPCKVKLAGRYKEVRKIVAALR